MAIVVDTKIMAIDCLWNQEGSILAVCGYKTDLNNKDSNVVLFYTAFGVVSIASIPTYLFILQNLHKTLS